MVTKKKLQMIDSWAVKQCKEASPEGGGSVEVCVWGGGELEIGK